MEHVRGSHNATLPAHTLALTGQTFPLCLQVMVACFEVFQTWEDEYEKLQVLLRDIVKRKREENLKMVWRLSPAHRKLQSRLDHMRRFRRQHEQLRAVIVRVLRPQVKYTHVKGCRNCG